jgi:hypothetical protein
MTAPDSKSPYTVEENRCDCHPETCCCQPAVLMRDGVKLAFGFSSDLWPISVHANAGIGARP